MFSKKCVQQCVKRAIHHNQVAFIQELQGWFNVRKPINVIHHINYLKKKTHMIVFLDDEKALDKIQHSFVMIAFSKMGKIMYQAKPQPASILK